MHNPDIKIYFPGLNGLRFVAALLVIINHIEFAKYYAGYSNYKHYPFFTATGDLSVTLFFVLSGFLITYLLLSEKKITNTIDIKNFYIKRILRIWPLYFLVIAITLLILSKPDLFNLSHTYKEAYDKLEFKQLLLLIVLPNIVTTIFFVPYLGHIWSIGVEEQFYLIWPWIIRATKNYLKVFLIIIMLLLIIGIVLFILKESTPNPEVFKYLENIKGCVSRLRIGCMAIGGIGAWIIFYKKEKILRLIYRKDLQWLTIVLISILFLTGPNIRLVKHEVYSILFCIIIMNLASNTHPILGLENKIFYFLGKISYGIYMYHPLIIDLCFGSLKQINGYTFGSPISDLILYSTTIFLTISVSAVSYHFFESRFLKLKDQFPSAVLT